MMAKKYLFESSKPESVKRRERKQAAERRSAAAKKSWETRRKKMSAAAEPKKSAAKPPKTKKTSSIKNKIRYLNDRIRKYGDPDHLLDLLPPGLKTDSGRLSTSADALKLYRSPDYYSLLDQLRASIHKRPVSNPVRDMFENMLGEIYDQIRDIGGKLFYEIMGNDFKKSIETDADTDTKMKRAIEMWKNRQHRIPEYYDEQIRSGKLTPFSD